MISERKYDSSSRQKQRREAEVDKKLRSLNISLCQYVQWYFNPDTTALQVLTHRPKLFNGHWASFEHVLNVIVEGGRQSSSKGRDRINTWIAKQSDSIVVQETKRSKPTHVPSHEMTPDHLTSDCIDEGLEKLQTTINTAWRGPIDGVVANRAAQDEVMEDTDGHGVQEHGTESQHRREQHLLFLAYACSRRSNATQHRNVFFALACGASKRLTTFLQE
ncbi:BZ3500_MvSof-1268-A1-R1_Chr5-3g08255 [Microbotryum saponariae]|uniref:BZ3500_MvSof-1268-A1-R1_Chr5-3g08255 protein n=1 Tax=Microbotryum saponariae TaxID=289078 RepID=A0A2X0M854_9BASI|nr:BZ3500_MvSof-1268-A1-R1_Chr5-3g08255 [Microbotryum saponariae]SDA08363.1 BZ3501_MvSof-1269-A2-R1_Chr5-3g07983 [Microbotryum saponariae]